MTINSVLSSGLRGVQSGITTVENAAREINANAADREPNALADFSTNLVELKRGKNNVQAALNVVKTADDILGTLLDTRI